MFSVKILTLLVAGTLVGGAEKPWEKSHRIPGDIIPLSYDLTLTPDLEQGKFSGEIKMDFNNEASRNWIPIHIKNLSISKVGVTHQSYGGRRVDVMETIQYLPHEFYVVRVRNIDKGEYRVSMTFNGDLTENISGFYKSVYYENGVGRSIATTTSEPVQARHIFPCFDEPALKAKFKIKIVRPNNNYSALSNMNIEREENGPGNDKVTVHFAVTQPMSTYLVGFIVSDLKDSGTVTVENKNKQFPLKIYSTPGQVNDTLFAKTVAAEVTKYYIDYFGIAYPLPKLDLVAIPNFVSSAMENWGLITFPETALLFNERRNSAANKMRVATGVAHEISHQWFGNLVTMNWWDDLWLNEGFASFMQYKGVDKGMPSCNGWEMLDHAIFDQIHPVLKMDSVVSSHPIFQNVDNPNQITEIFDSISYNKGHAVIKMLEGFMGEEKFRNGITDYLNAHAYSTAASPNLWYYLNKYMNSSEVNVSQVMDTWTKQAGYPVVNVERASDGWLLTQSRFLADGNTTFNSSDSPYGYKWDIPIHYLYDVNSKASSLIWLKSNDTSVTIPWGYTKNYIKLNFQQLGFYRVNYDLETWLELQRMLMESHENFDKKDRANLIDDAFALAKAGNLSYSIALNMTKYLKKEREYLPWATGASALSELSELLTSSLSYVRFRKYLRDLVNTFFISTDGRFKLFVDSDNGPSQRQLRVKILNLACMAGLPSCLEDVKKQFLAWIELSDTAIQPDIRPIVFRYGMKYINKESIWDTVWDRYLKETNPQEKINLLQCLASSSEPWILNRFIKYAENETYVRSQDYFQVLGYISENPVGNPIIWNYYTQEWLNLVERFSLHDKTMGTFILTVTNRFSTEVQLEEMKAFFNRYPEAGAGVNARKIALERVENNINWLRTHEGAISQWVNNMKELDEIIPEPSGSDKKEVDDSQLKVEITNELEPKNTQVVRRYYFKIVPNTRKRPLGSKCLRKKTLYYFLKPV